MSATAAPAVLLSASWLAARSSSLLPHMARVLVVLDYEPPLAWLQRCTPRWDLIIAADGAGQAVKSWLTPADPVVIVGDLDSIQDKESLPSSWRVIPIPSQDYHDGQKAVYTAQRAVQWGLLGSRITHLYMAIAGGIGGRMDHTISTLSLLAGVTTHSMAGADWLAQLQCDAPECSTRMGDAAAAPPICHIQDCVLLTDGGTCRMLQAGLDYRIELSELECNPVGVCNLAPQTVTAQTTGLRWNLSAEHPIAMGGLQSSSNKVVDKQVDVQASGPVFWCTTLNPPADS